MSEDAAAWPSWGVPWQPHWAEYLEHQTWRCCYTTRYPGQCLCGLDAVLDKLGMGAAKDTDDPTWRSFT